MKLYNLDKVKKAKDTLRAITNKRRIEIIKLIDSKGQINVTDLYVKLKMPQPIASQQLAILRRTNIVLTERKGKQILYSINYPKIAVLNEGTQRINGEI